MALLGNASRNTSENLDGIGSVRDSSMLAWAFDRVLKSHFTKQILPSVRREKMAGSDLALMAHLMRRAGFGATREELESYISQGYEEAVERLLHPEQSPVWEEDVYIRSFPDLQDRTAAEPNEIYWAYRMVATQRPLEEKLALFWHGILCSGGGKADNTLQVSHQIEMFRQHGMGSFRELLLELSMDPAMLYYLDNVENHKGSVNENYGRELLELFSFGVGMDDNANYTEDDVIACSRAFTGWSVHTPLPAYPYVARKWQFIYDPGDHDDSEKTFMGESGPWNGDDIIDIIVCQPSTARFIARHLYNFFVADEPPVPYWKGTPPRDLKAIQLLEKTFVESNYNMRDVLRVMFNADFFKEARFEKAKSPAEVVIGTLKLIQDYTTPKLGMLDIVREMNYMGQQLMNPPTVEGWHTGKDWVDTGTLVARTNFVADKLGRTGLPGVKNILDRLMSEFDVITPEGLVDSCLDVLGPLEVSNLTRAALVDYSRKRGALVQGMGEDQHDLRRRTVEMLQLVSACPEYQFG